MKTHHVDLDFESLLEAADASGIVDVSNKEAVDAGRKSLTQRGDGLWSMAIDDARTAFSDVTGWPGNEAYTTIYAGVNIRAKYDFLGRSSGWLVMTEFKGQVLDLSFDLEEMSNRDLRALAEMVHYIDISVANGGVAKAVQDAAAWIIFNDLHD